jgi:hypothetical protein
MDGNTVSIAALKASPGTDNVISLREAVLACGNERTGTIKRINFDNSLKDKTISVDTRWLGEGTGTIVLTDGICINGDIDGDGTSDITITDAYPGGESSHIFTAWANDITIASIKFKGIVRGIAFATYNPSTVDGVLRMNTERVAVLNCEFSMADVDAIDSVGIQVTAAGYLNGNMKTLLDAEGKTTPITDNLNFSDFSLSDVTFAGNSFKDILAIWVLASGNVGGRYDDVSGTMTPGYENDRVVFEDITISANKSSGSKGVGAIAMVVTDCNSAQDKYNFPNTSDYSYAENCVIQNTLIRGNTLSVDNRDTWPMMIYNSNMGNSRNTLSGVVIDYNDISASGNRPALSLGNTGGNDHENAGNAKGNITKDISITNNSIKTSGATGIEVYNAVADFGPSQDNNTVENLTINSNNIEIELTQEVTAISVANAIADQEIQAAQEEPHYSSNNSMKDISITRNKISYIPYGEFTQLFDWDLVSIHRAAINIYAANANGSNNLEVRDSIAKNNNITGLTITGNAVKGAVCSLNIEGGRGPNADRNTVTATVSGNSFSGRFYALDNMQDAKGNTVTVSGNQQPCKEITADFADTNFLAEIKPFTNRMDGFIFDADVSDIKELTVPSKGIGSLSGLNYFTALETLNCSDNNLSEIDVRGLDSLLKIFCSGNYLPSKAAIIGLNENRTEVDFGTQKHAYAIHFSVTGIGGSLTATVDGGGISTGEAVQPGKSVVFTAVPNSGYRVKEWKDNGATVNGTALTYTLSGIATIHTITVEFTGFGEVPSTGVPEVTATAMIISILISAVFWISILRRKPEQK